MAEIVLGIGTSHTPMLSMAPEMWPEHARLFDGSLPDIDFAARAADAEPWVKDELTLPVWQRKHAAAQTAIDTIRTMLADASPDIVVIVGNDQREMFEEYTPMFAMMDALFVNDLPDDLDALPAPQRSAWWAYHGDEPVRYPVHRDLSAYITDALIDGGFDVAVCTGETTGRSVGHAFTFVERRIMSNPDTPIVPVMLNTYYPPNQTSPRRCVEFGRALAASVQSWESDARVAVIASGGLSHFAVEADLDRRVLEQMKAEDFEALASVSRGEWSTGTSEILNWVCAASMLSAAGRRMELLEYIPAYRSIAKTGVGIAFAAWT